MRDLRSSRSRRGRTLLVSPGEQRATHLDRVQAEQLAETIEGEDGLLSRRLDPLERLEVDLSLFAAKSDFLAECFDSDKRTAVEETLGSRYRCVEQLSPRDFLFEAQRPPAVERSR